MVCDMSSDIFSRQLDFSKFDLIYAGAQKNMGPAGVTLVVIKKEILGKTGRENMFSILDYSQHISKESMYNTGFPCLCFSVNVTASGKQWWNCRCRSKK
jgi:phosphoserine aminotransferase